MTLRQHRNMSCALVAAWVLLLALPGAATSILSDAAPWQDITSSITYLPDADASRTIEEVAALPASSFLTPDAISINLGVHVDAVWLRVELDNQTTRTNWVLELNNARIEEVRLFSPGPDGGWTDQATGTDHPIKERLALHVLPALKLKVPRGETTVYYVRAKHSGSLRFQVHVSLVAIFQQNVTNRTAAAAAIGGGLIAMIIFNLVVFIQLREIGYFFLAAAVFSFLLFSAALNGAGYIWLWPDAHWWSGRSVTTTASLHHVFISLFFWRFMLPAKNTPRVNRIGLVFAVLFVAITLLCMTDMKIKYYAIAWVGSLGPMVFVAAAIYAWWRGFRPAGHFALAWTLSVIGVVSLTIINGGFANHSYFRESAVSVAYLLSVVIWNLSLAERLRLSERTAREQLEVQVGERTRDLQQALDEVKNLSGLLPICSSCKKIRGDHGYWQGVEQYLHEHTEAQFSHSVCPDCMESLYPGYADRIAEFDEEPHPLP